MSQSTMCLKCFEPVQKGWNQVHHIQQCRGRPNSTNFTQAKATLQHNIDDHPNQELTEVDDPGENQLADKEQDMDQGGIIATDVLGGQRAKEKLRVLFSPKTREILEFLGTAEMGEGCSREHAQGWLDYQKTKLVQVRDYCLRIFGRAGSTLRRSIQLWPSLSLPCLAPHYVSTSPLLHLLCLTFHCHA
jgi:hypothetical protein